MKKTEHFVSLKTSVILIKKSHVTVNSEELIGATEYRML